MIEHRPGRTITETDNLLMTTLTGNTAPLHLDAHYAAGTEWGQMLVCSLVTLAVVGGMTVRSTSGLTVANLGWRDIELTAPVFIGDTLYAETEIIGKRRSASRPEIGIVTCRTTGYKTTGDRTGGTTADDGYPGVNAGADAAEAGGAGAPGQRVVQYTRSFFVPIDGTTRAELGY